MAWKKYFILFCIIPCFLLGFPRSLKEQVVQGKAGDFVVMQQEGHYTLLLIRSLSQDTLLLEEVAVPAKQIDLEKIVWQDWLSQKAPGHTSWSLYEIDIKLGKLREGFSWSQNGWLGFNSSEHVLSRLLLLPLSPIPSSERKKIGGGGSNEEDHRALWNPPVIFQGKRMKGSFCTALKAVWPTDDSLLSSIPFTFYFSESYPKFPFPIWLEAHTPHYTFKLRSVDFGSSLTSPFPASLPKRAPKIVELKKEQTQWLLHLRSPSYFPSFRLFAIGENSGTIEIPCKKTENKEKEIFLEISIKDLQARLTKKELYQWMVVPDSDQPLSAVSFEKFYW